MKAEEEREKHAALTANEQTVAETPPPGPVRHRRYDPIETRARILEAAYNLFSTEGYEHSSTADIARTAGVSEGSIFYHFASKPSLLAELGRLHGERIISAFETGSPPGSGDYLSGFHSLFDYLDGLPFSPEAREGEDSRLQARPRDTHPFFDAARHVVIAWMRRRMQGFKTIQTPVDEAVTTSLLAAVVDDAVRQYRTPGATTETRRKVRSECLRFVSALLDGPGNR